MKYHIEFEDFGEYVEAFDGENFLVAGESNDGGTIELILFEEGAA